eukprot:362159-Chlamydomonas_euryale.AAC.9
MPSCHPALDALCSATAGLRRAHPHLPRLIAWLPSPPPGVPQRAIACRRSATEGPPAAAANRAAAARVQRQHARGGTDCAKHRPCRCQRPRRRPCCLRHAGTCTALCSRSPLSAQATSATSLAQPAGKVVGARMARWASTKGQGGGGGECNIVALACGQGGRGEVGAAGRHQGGKGAGARSVRQAGTKAARGEEGGGLRHRQAVHTPHGQERHSVRARGGKGAGGGREGAVVDRREELQLRPILQKSENGTLPLKELLLKAPHHTRTVAIGAKPCPSPSLPPRAFFAHSR